MAETSNAHAIRVLDRSLKPTFSSYEFRPQRAGQLLPPEVDNELPSQANAIAEEAFEQASAAWGSGGALVVIAQREAAVAKSRCEAGEPRQAVMLLRRACRRLAAAGADTPATPSERCRKAIGPPLAARLASAMLTVEIGVVLAESHAYDDAMTEARSGIELVDKVLRRLLLTDVSSSSFQSCRSPVAEQQIEPPSQEKCGAGAVDSLRAVLQNPPPWMQHLVETLVRSRGLVAELYEKLAMHPECSPEASCDFFAEAQRARSEQGMLATNFLPDKHPLVLKAKEGVQVATKRRHRALHVACEGSPPREDSELSEFADDALLLRLGQSKRLHAALSTPTSRSTSAGLPGMGQSLNSTGFSSASSGLAPSASAPALHYAACPRGDVFAASLPAPSARSSKSASSSRAATTAGGTSSSGFAGTRRDDIHESDTLAAEGLEAGSRPQHGPFWAPGQDDCNRANDPFTDWLTNQTDLDKLNLTQLTLRTDEGATKLKFEIKDKGVLFKQLWMKELSFDQLYDDRILYCDHGVNASQRIDAKKAFWRNCHNKETPEEARVRKGLAAMHQKYAVKQPKRADPPDEAAELRSLGKLMTAQREYGKAKPKAAPPRKSYAARKTE